MGAGSRLKVKVKAIRNIRMTKVQKSALEKVLFLVAQAVTSSLSMGPVLLANSFLAGLPGLRDIHCVVYRPVQVA